MNKYIYSLAAFMCSVLLFTTCYYRDCYNDLITELHEKEVQAEIDKLKDENKYTTKLIEIKDVIHDETKDIENTYNHIADMFDNSLTNGLYNNQNSTEMSSSTRTNKRISEKGSGELKKCRTAYKRIRTEYLILAKDYDITLIHYNNLIDYYNSLR